MAPTSTCTSGALPLPTTMSTRPPNDGDAEESRIKASVLLLKATTCGEYSSDADPLPTKVVTLLFPSEKARMRKFPLSQM